jgi:transcriptional regulatory protein RtcR
MNKRCCSRRSKINLFPVGSDKEVQADFQLIAGTNKDLRTEVQAGRFREDLWARLNTWTFFLPNLKDRIEDIAPNIEFELQRFAVNHQRQLRFQRDALDAYLKFAKSKEASWQGNFRDLTASVTRLATLSSGELIRSETVEKEIQRLKQLWSIQTIQNQSKDVDILLKYLDQTQLSEIDEFDQIQLRGVLQVCENAKSMADAGRQLFAASRQQRNTTMTATESKSIWLGLA